MVRVLIADDDEYVRILMRRVIKSLHYESVGEAADGLAALEMYRKTKPDILLLDIDMPKKNGIEILRTIKEDDRNTSVIMLTSHAETERVQTCIELGAESYLRKDTPMAKIKSAIEPTVINSVQKKLKDEKH
jgi:two-component system, chemotaxis family, chemotaxis protein CheY